MKTSIKKKLVAMANIILIVTSIGIGVFFNQMEAYASDPDDTHVYIIPEETNVYVGEEFNVTIWCNTNQRISGWGFEFLNFTQGKLNCSNIEMGYFFADNGTSVTGVGTIHNDTGVIGGSWVDYCFEVAAGGCWQNNTNNTVLILTLQAISAGQANITFESVGDAEFGYGGYEVPYTLHNQNITISSPSNPPALSDEYPSDGATGVSVPPLYFNLTVNDPDGDTMNITWQTNESGGWITFNTSIDKTNGTYYAYNTSWVDSFSTKYWWSVLVNDSEGNWTNQTYSFTTEAENQSPVINESSAMPVNNSIGVDIDQPSVSVWIYDPDGDAFNWSIEVNNTDCNSANNENNGTKSCSLTTTLSYSTTYTWWINVSDGCSNKTFVFTTRDQYTPSPPSNFVASTYSDTQINLTWSNAGGNKTVVCGKTGNYPTDPDTNQLYNGTLEHYEHSGLSSNVQYFYKSWSWNETDSVYSTSNTTATNTTQSENQPPTFSNENPSNGSIDVPISTPIWNATIEDSEGDTFNWSIDTSPDIGSNSNNGDTNGSKSVSLSGLDFSTEYTVYVNATDLGSGCWTNKTYIFTTRSEHIPDPPYAFTATADGRFEIDLTWVKGAWADCTYIEWNTTETWSRGESVLLYNGTGTLVSQSGLSPGTTRYYEAWSWNTTDGTWSTFYSSDNATTNSNNPPSFGTPSPSNGSSNQELSFTWSISITDADGDTFNWSIECSNGQSDGANGDTDGTKELSLSGLDYSTEYKVWVNATDTYDWTKEWFTFTSKGNDPPVLSNENPANGSTGVPISTIEWSVTIEDPEGDSIDWWIETSPDVGSDSDTGDINGTKSVSLSGLQYNTNYTVYVNTTSSGWTNETYWFVTELDLVASFTHSPSTNLTIDDTIQFIDQSTGSSTSWSWSFGDGSSSNIQNPNHKYSMVGIYQVVLTITNGGFSETVSEMLHIGRNVSVVIPVGRATTYHIFTWTNHTATCASDVAALIGLSNFESIFLYDNSEARWYGLTVGIGGDDFPINRYDSICTLVGSNKTFWIAP